MSHFPSLCIFAIKEPSVYGVAARPLSRGLADLHAQRPNESGSMSPAYSGLARAWCALYFQRRRQLRGATRGDAGPRALMHASGTYFGSPRGGRGLRKASTFINTSPSEALSVCSLFIISRTRIVITISSPPAHSQPAPPPTRAACQPPTHRSDHFHP